MKKFKDVSRLVFGSAGEGRRLQGAEIFRLSAMSLALAYLIFVTISVFKPAEAGTGPDAPVQMPVPEADQAANEVTPPDLLQIADWHLFGQASGGNPDDSAIAETSLQLKLLGVFRFTQASDAGYAIIQAEDGAQKKYRLGDDLPGGATLKAVEASRVVLSHGGRQEFLALQKNSLLPPANTE